jgi:tripartite-type tricarboxylate transporter receptor subunit TctC
MKTVIFIMLGIASLLGVGTARSQGFPNRPIKFVVPFAPGGTTDVLARILASKMGEGLGQSVVVDNKPGAGGNIGAEFVAKSPPDGYTLLVGTPGPLAINVSLMRKVPYDPVKDFSAIGQFVGVQSVILAGPNQPFRSIADVVAFGKQNPGKLTFGSAGMGSSPHLAMELFNASAGLQMVHVAYKGDAPALTDLIGGQVQLMVANLAGVITQIKAGKVRPLAVAGPKRSSLLPDVPTVAESGVAGFSVTGWAGVVAPAGTPKAIVDRLNAELNKALAAPELIDKIQQQASEPVSTTPEQFSDLIKSENLRWAKVIRDARIQVE